MNTKIATGTAFVLANPILNATAAAIGIAKTGTAIGTLQGAAHTSAAAAWIGFGSMNMGMFMMGAFPVIGALLILDGICGHDHGSPLLDCYEESWKRYEIQCELEEMKKEVKVNKDHQVRAKTTAVSMAQLNNQFQALEIENELDLMKKNLGLI